MKSLKMASWIFAALTLTMAALMLGCGNDGSIMGGAYSAEYKITGDIYNVYVETTVKGPAAKLAVVLTDPNGESKISIIEQDEMMGNNKTVKVWMEKPSGGTWVLAVKTVNPEKIVWHKDILFSLDNFSAEDVKLDFTPNLSRFKGYFIEGLNIIVKKDGNLPIEFTDISATIDGEKCFARIGSTRMMVSQQYTVNASITCSPTPEMEKRDRAEGNLPFVSALFRPGEKHSIRGKIFFDKGHKSMDFKKDFVVPAAPK